MPKKYVMVLLVVIISMTAMGSFQLYVRSASLEKNCYSHLSQIKVALRIYASENQGLFPPTLETLVSENLISDDTLRPLASLEKFRYFPPREGAVSPREIIVAEPLSNHSGRGSHALRQDGTVEWIKAAEGAKSGL